MNEILKIVMAMFLIRERDHNARKEFWGSIAYANAFDWLCDALKDDTENLSQYDGYEEAKRFIEEHPDLEFWGMEDYMKGW